MPSLEDKLRAIASEMEGFAPVEQAMPLGLHPEIPMLRRNERALNTIVPPGTAPCRDGVALIARDTLDDAWDIEGTVFLDTETTGLSGAVGTLAFLIGIGYVQGESFVVEQYFMQDYDREPQVLFELRERLRRFDTLVTYNGKTFDIPILNNRSILNRIRLDFDGMNHIDLLHAARRMWRRRLGSCSLQNVEREVLQMHREGDVSGAMAPVIFYEFLKTGDMTMMEEVIRHNRTDIESLYGVLAELSCRLCAPDTLEDACDALSAGKIFEQQGLEARALACYEQAWALDEAVLAWAAIHKRARRYERACPAWEELTSRAGEDSRPYEELAKYCEHIARDYAAALAWTALCMEREAYAGGEGRASLQKRRRRLEQKLEKKQEENA